MITLIDSSYTSWIMPGNKDSFLKLVTYFTVFGSIMPYPSKSHAVITFSNIFYYFGLDPKCYRWDKTDLYYRAVSCTHMLAL